MTTPTPRPARSHLTLVDDRDHPAGGPGTGGHPASGPEPGTEAAAPASVAGGRGTARPGMRRRTGWFVANPGCFGRAALIACGAGFTAGGATAWAAWRLWRSSPAARLAVGTFGLSRRLRRRSRALRRRLGR